MTTPNHNGKKQVLGSLVLLKHGLGVHFMVQVLQFWVSGELAGAVLYLMFAALVAD